MLFSLQRLFVRALLTFGLRMPGGIALRPMPEKAFKSPWSFVCIVLKETRFAFSFFLALAIVTGLASVIWMFPFKTFLSTLENLSDRSEVWSVILWPAVHLIIAWLVIDLAFRGLFLMRAAIIRPDIEYIVTKRMTALILDRKLTFFKDTPSAINSRINQLAEGVYDTVLTITQFVVPTIIGILGSIISLLIFNPWIGLVATLYSFVHVTIVLLNMKKLIKCSSVASTSHNMVMHNTLNVINNITTVKAFDGDKREFSILGLFHSRRRNVNRISLLYPEKMKVLLAINGFIVMCCILIAMQIHFFSKGIFKIADISFVFSFCFDLVRCIIESTDDFVQTVEDIGRCEEGIAAFRSSFNHIEPKKHGHIKLKPKNGSIVFSHVTFCHSNEKNRPLFDNQSVVIKNGESVGLVGLSGSGKTTFINLIMGYYSPSRGKITVGEVDITKMGVHELRNNITLMEQGAGLFDRTILDNIKYGKPDATMEEVIRATKMAHAHDFITEFPEGYYTRIRDGGSIMSGGQKQRIALARAFLRHSPILILDEATSALDNHTQAILQKSMDALMKNRTTITIAHRLSVVKDLDKILVFRAGKIVEQGSHRKLISNKDGYYSYLWSLQNSSAE